MRPERVRKQDLVHMFGGGAPPQPEARQKDAGPYFSGRAWRLPAGPQGEAALVRGQAPWASPCMAQSDVDTPRNRF